MPLKRFYTYDFNEARPCGNAFDNLDEYLATVTRLCGSERAARAASLCAAIEPDSDGRGIGFELLSYQGNIICTVWDIEIADRGTWVYFMLPNPQIDKLNAWGDQICITSDERRMRDKMYFAYRDLRFIDGTFEPFERLLAALPQSHRPYYCRKFVMFGGHTKPARRVTAAAQERDAGV